MDGASLGCADVVRRAYASGAVESDSATACAAESSPLAIAVASCCRLTCLSCSTAGTGHGTAETTSWRARTCRLALMPLVGPEPGDVRRRRGRKLAGGRGLTARNTRYHLDTIVWCCLNWQCFLLFFTEYKAKITRQSARPFAARRVISARPSPRPRRRSQLRAQVRGELFSATTSTRTATTEYGARAHA